MRMIFHIPKNIYLDGKSGGQIRPYRMYKAFKNLGYEISIISGNARERKKSIKKVKDDIENGVKYDFLYAESSTLPVALTEKHHLPLYPFMDFNFFEYLKKKQIKIGLFYRDVYWNFDFYSEKVSLSKRLIGRYFYKYDLKRYQELLDVLYLPSLRMYDYIPFDFVNKISPLPPGIESSKIPNIKDDIINCSSGEHLNIFYVGGIGAFYDLEELFKTVYYNEHIRLTVCCRQNEWEEYKLKYTPFVNNRIEIIHKSGSELIPYFEDAHLASLVFKPIEYRKFAMPTKLFEYMQYQVPIIATRGTSAGDFVENNDLGWAVDYSVKSLNNLLDYIFNNLAVLKEKAWNIKRISKEHTWERRALKVADDLTE